MMLTLEVTSVVFSPSMTASGSAGSSMSTSGANGAASSSSGGQETTAALHIAGRVSEEARDVKMGAFHTLDIEANRDVRIIKALWDSISLSRIEEACVEGRGAEVGAIVCGEGKFPFMPGTAAVCLLSEHMTTVRQRIDVPVPRKRMGSVTLHDKVSVRTLIFWLARNVNTLSLSSAHSGYGTVLRYRVHIPSTSLAFQFPEGNCDREPWFHKRLTI
jgi:protein pelota